MKQAVYRGAESRVGEDVRPAWNGIPEGVEFAYEVMCQCNRITEPIIIDDGERNRVYRPKLEPRQEQAFTVACEVITRYLLKLNHEGTHGENAS